MPIVNNEKTPASGNILSSAQSVITSTNVHGKGQLMVTCDKCNNFNKLQFDVHCSTRTPIGFIEGNPESPIWIIGINPRDDGAIDERSQEHLPYYFTGTKDEAKRDKVSDYFDVFEVVSPWLYDQMMRPTEEKPKGNVAHTDLVKCRTPTWPREIEVKQNGASTNKVIRDPYADRIITNCVGFLATQIFKYKPRLVICNGAPVRDKITTIIPPGFSETYRASRNHHTVYHGNYVNSHHKYSVVAFGTLKGQNRFMDNRYRRDLGEIIEDVAQKNGLR